MIQKNVFMLFCLRETIKIINSIMSVLNCMGNLFAIGNIVRVEEFIIRYRVKESVVFIVVHMQNYKALNRTEPINWYISAYAQLNMTTG